MTSDDSPQPERAIDTTVSHSARIWNYWLGGKDHYPIDREVGDYIRGMYPDIVDLARHDRAFLGRAVRHLADECEIRQFLEIGTGLPTADNTHEVAQRIAPGARIVYVDNDPMVLAHARALLTSGPKGHTDYVGADLRDPEGILSAASKSLDFSKPIAVMLLGIVHFIHDDAEALRIMRTLLEACCSGSYLVVAHLTNVIHGERTNKVVRHWNEFGTPAIRTRTPSEILGFFEGLDLELLAPGVVSCSRWRPEPTPWGLPPEVEQLCGVGRKW